MVGGSVHFTRCREESRLLSAMELSKLMTFAFLLNGYIGLCMGNFNLFMNETESRRLLGIEGELFYVREGEVNNYALTFDMMIRKEVNDIYFNWQNLRLPPDRVMLYRMGLTSSNPQALPTPVANIPREGVVPTKLSLFQVSLPCTGLITAEVEIRIQLNVTIFSASNITTLNINRKKACIKASSDYPGVDYPDLDPSDPYHVVGQGGSQRGQPDINLPDMGLPDLINPDLVKEPGGMDSPVEEDEVGTTSTNVFYIAVGSACGAILLVALTVAIYYVRSQKAGGSQTERLSETSSARTIPQHHKSQYQRPETTTPNGMSRFPQSPELVPDFMSETSSTRGLPMDENYKRAVTPNIYGHHGGSMSRRRMSPVGCGESSPPEYVQAVLAEIQVDRSRVTLTDVIMEGTFGRIYHGLLAAGQEGEEAEPQHVVVKMVTEVARPDQVEVMLKESCTMKQLAHPNTHTVIACCLQQPPFLIYTHQNNDSNLKKFLQRCKVSDIHQPLNTQQIVFMAIQVIRGLIYLHKCQLVHRDVAARNCVVDSRLIVKVSDHALSRDLFPGDYHCLGDNENRPVKWLSLEALLEKKFSYASDVWAFGVLVWELLTLAQQPYSDIDPFEMASYLSEGYRIAQPINCPDELFAVMACCWALGPDERPMFTQLHVCLQDFYTALGRFI